jgi:metal-responsive CopG/Arc/MetJ family transcriptional regulator
MGKTTVSLSLSEELVEILDQKRALVARSVFVEYLLQKILEAEQNGQL